MRKGKPKRITPAGGDIIVLFKRKAGAHPHKNTKRRKTRGEQNRQAIAEG